MPEEVLQIGVSRPALPLADLPTPEAVFALPILVGCGDGKVYCVQP
jgi:hypothetical protein